MTEDEMAGWHHRLDGHGFQWTLGVGDGQGGLVCCNSRGHIELDTTEQLNWTEKPNTLSQTGVHVIRGGQVEILHKRKYCCRHPSLLGTFIKHPITKESRAQSHPDDVPGI